MTHRTTSSSRFLLSTSTVALAVALLLAGCKNRPSDSSSEASEQPAAEQEQEQRDESASTDTGSAEGESGEQAASDDSEESESEKPSVLRGRVTPGRVTEVFPEWRDRVEAVDVDSDDAEALGEVEPGAEVTVYFGTWCGDSRREVPRLWKALRSAGGDVPFSVDYIALDRDFEAGDVSLEGKEIQYVPTFVVERDGEEVGRIVESAPDKLERDLRALLAGDEEGVLSKRNDL